MDSSHFASGQLVGGVVRRLDGSGLILDLGGGVEGVLPPAEQACNEPWAIGDRLRALVVDVREEGPGRTTATLSRASDAFLLRLLEAEIPEIAAGAVVVSALAREPGAGTKVAVHSEDQDTDPVAACRGRNDENLQRILGELRGERVDFVRWSPDALTFIGNALLLGPGVRGEVNEPARKALVLVADHQLSSVIGRKGQNVRLAARLTGWDIDIMTPPEADRFIAGQ